MKIENEFKVAASLERTWELLTDIPAIAPCLPGAQLTDHDGDIYNGKMKVKVGPITAQYTGTATITELDEIGRRVLLSARGRDTRGGGNASADIEVNMASDGDGTLVSINTDLMVAGRVAQFGRGVMADVSRKLLERFAACIEAELGEPPANDDPTDDEASATSVTSATSDTESAPTEASASTSAPTEPSTPIGAPSSAPTEASASADAEQNDSLDLLALAGSALAKRLIPLAVATAGFVVLLWIRRSCSRPARDITARDITG